MDVQAVAMFGLPGGSEWIVVGLVALLIFGRRLPDVARSVGKSIVEFKRGLRDVKDDVEAQSRIESSKPPKLGDNSAGTSGDKAASDAKEEASSTVSKS